MLGVNMSGKATYKISSDGVLEGYEPNNVIAEFATAFGVAPEKAIRYVEQKKLIKKDLSQKQALAFKEKLNALGLALEIEKVEPVDEFGGMSLVADDAPVSNGTGQTNASIAATDSSSEFSCPKCKTKQEQTSTCSSCGVIIEKYLAAQNAKNQKVAGSESPQIAQSINRSSSRNEDESDFENDNDGFSLQAMGIALAVALVGAFAWKFFAVQFDREFGILAWAIGGAIGAAAAFAGSRGVIQGTICALLCVFAITGGKYMTAGYYTDQMLEAGGEEVADVFEEFQSAVTELEAIGDDKKAIKQYMLDYEYTEAEFTHAISDEEYEWFMQEVKPFLSEMAAASASGEDGAMRNALGTFSTIAVFISLWGLMDILFLLVGAASAFRLASEGTD